VINGNSVLAVIAARGGSKGLPGKNLRLVGGRPMVAWSALAATSSALVDRVVISTDDPAIAAAAVAAGAEAPFIRPAELADDEAGIAPVLIHAIDALDGAWDYIVLLQATSPLRRGEDIDACVSLCDGTGAPAVIAVTRPPKSPYWSVTLDGEGRMHRLIEAPPVDRRQALPPTFMPNGAVYVARVEWFRRSLSFVGADTRAYVMPPERSVDVDDELDLLMAEALISQRLRMTDTMGRSKA